MSNSTDRTQTQFFVHDAPLPLMCGRELPNYQLAYETYGKLNEDRSNAILLFHALSGSQHAHGYTESVEGVGDLWTEECRHGWWDDFIGPGKALDTDQFFIICANYLGGCYGTTGPRDINPETGKPYGADFPNLRVADLVDSQVPLLDHLKIDRLHAVVGSSVGGLMVLSFATRYPNRVTTVISVGSAIETSPLQRILTFEQIFAIESDPNFNGGNYYDGTSPTSGLALARMISHKTFISLRTMEKRATSEVRSESEHLSWYDLSTPLESYMLHQGTKFSKRFDANTYLRVLEVWQKFDACLEAGVDDYKALFAPCKHQRYLVFSIDSDVCFYPDQQTKLCVELKEAGINSMHITVHSDKGHDSFLLQPELFTPHLFYILNAAKNV